MHYIDICKGFIIWHFPSSLLVI